jgi:hypothetical protein
MLSARLRGVWGARGRTGLPLKAFSSPTRSLGNLLAFESFQAQYEESGEQEAEREVCEQLAATPRQQGLGRGRGLHKRMAELLKVSETTISRRIQEFAPG